LDPRELPYLDSLVTEYQSTPLGHGKDDVAARDEILCDPLLCALLMLKANELQAVIAGTETPYAQAARKLLRLIEPSEGHHRACGMHLVRMRDRTLLFADTTLNISPDAETLADIAISAAAAARRFEVDPVVGMLSFNNFGASGHPEARKVGQAVRIIRTREPDLPVIGELQADWAVAPEDFEKLIPKERSIGGRPANVLIFPNLSAANIAFRLVRVLGEGDVIGPVMLGIPYSVGLLPRGASAMEIARMAVISSFEARSLHRA
jgi:malate dehydrogenase (oxaloacetate-decarboxylating)(NADP+)